MFKKTKRLASSYHSYKTNKGDIHFLLKRSSARRSLAICINEKAQVTVSVPFYSTLADAQRFIAQKHAWILEKVSKASKNLEYIQNRRFEHGQEFLFLGEKYKLFVQTEASKRSKIAFDGSGWMVSLPKDMDAGKYPSEIKKRLLGWYKEQAQEILGGRLWAFARQMNLEPQSIAVRRQKRFWGCCDYNKQSISLNWQIILSPARVADYVIVHELCHLKVPNHSKRFWKMVEKYMPDYKQQKKWLSANHLDMVLP